MRALRSIRRRRTAWLAERLQGLTPAELAAVDAAIEPLLRLVEGTVTAALLALNSRTFSSLRKHRNYRLYFTGQIVSVSGTWMQDTALPWLVLALTHSPVYVGLLVFARYAPFMVFGLFSGALADRFDNRRVVIVTQASSMLVAAALAALAFSGVHQIWPYFVLALLGGAALVFDAPNRHALTFQLVGRDELPNAVALNSSLFNAARVVGPAVGGVLIAAVGVGWCFAINAGSFLAVLAALLLMRAAELFPLDREAGATKTGAAIREGLAYVWRSPQVKLVLAITVVVSATGLQLPRAAARCSRRRRCTRAPSVFGVLFACFGAGALVGALGAAALGRASWKALILGAARVQRSDAPARAGAQRGRRRRAPARDRLLLLDLDGRTASRSSSSPHPTVCAAGCSASTCSRSRASHRWAGCSRAGSRTSAERSSRSASPA